MGKFVEENLGSGETVRYTATISLWSYIFSFVIGGVLALVSVPVFVMSIFAKGAGFSGSVMGVIAICALLLIVWPFIARRSTELVITDKRFIAKYGLVSTHSIEIRFDKIETVRVDQSLLGKMLNYGDIVVTGTGSTFDPIRNVANAMKFRLALNQAMDALGAGNRSAPLVA
jgi:uncharacterized membrane protein YdbT with pleckstrin-like domain